MVRKLEQENPCEVTRRVEVSKGGLVDGNGWGFGGTESLVSDKYLQLVLPLIVYEPEIICIVSVLRTKFLLRLPLKL